MQPLLEIDDLSVAYVTRAGDVPAVRNVSLSLATGGKALPLGKPLLK